MIWPIIKSASELVEIRSLSRSDNFEVTERAHGTFFPKTVALYHNANKWKSGSGVLTNWNHVLEGCGTHDSSKYFHGRTSVGVEPLCINLKLTLNLWLQLSNAGMDKELYIPRRVVVHSFTKISHMQLKTFYTNFLPDFNWISSPIGERLSNSEPATSVVFVTWEVMRNWIFARLRGILCKVFFVNPIFVASLSKSASWVETEPQESFLVDYLETVRRETLRSFSVDSDVYVRLI